MLRRIVLLAMLCVSSASVAQEKKPPKFDWKNAAPPSTQWKQVRVTSDTKASDGCKSVGTVYGKLYRLQHREVTSEMVYDELKRNAAEKKANLVVLIGPATQVGVNASDTGMEASGEAYVCASNDPIRQAIGDACNENFALGVSLRKGSTYKSNIPYPTLSKTALLTRLADVAPQHEVTVLNTDAAAGVVTAEATSPRKNVKVLYSFAISDETSGARIEVLGKLPGILNNAQNDEVRTKLCALMSAVAPGTATSASGSRELKKTGASETSVEDRLKKLDNLLKKKLITKEEYDKKRAALLNEL